MSFYILLTRFVIGNGIGVITLKLFLCMLDRTNLVNILTLLEISVDFHWVSKVYKEEDKEKETYSVEFQLGILV